MASVLTIDGSVTKAADAGAGYTLPIEVSEDVESMFPATIRIPAQGMVQPDISSVTSQADVIIIRSPRTVHVSLLWGQQQFPMSMVENLPVREYFVLQTTGVVSISLVNQGDTDVTVELLVAKLAE